MPFLAYLTLKFTGLSEGVFFFVFLVADLGVTRRADIFKKPLIHLSQKTFFVIKRREFLVPATVK